MTGHYRCYVNINFRPDRLERVRRAAKIIDEYEAQGLVMSLRQLYYQLVSRGVVPNESKMYDQLQEDVSDGRLAGMISWTGIEDRERALKGHAYSEDPARSLEGLAAGYRTDKWADQPIRPEVWVEKVSLEGVVATVCSELEVDFFACKGYSSQSEQWRAGRRLAGYVGRGQRPVIFHLGDHDPSGLDMTRDNRERVSLFAGVPVQVVRLALNMSQIEELRPPPNPAKVTDARYAVYAAEYGEESWELDALSPTYIRDVIRGAVMRVRDERRWLAALEAEAAEREVLAEFAAQLSERGG